MAHENIPISTHLTLSVLYNTYILYTFPISWYMHRIITFETWLNHFALSLKREREARKYQNCFFFKYVMTTPSDIPAHGTQHTKHFVTAERVE